MIMTHGLTKRFGSVLAVDGIDLEVREGDRYGFLGPNGSGKTTTVRMLLGLVFATSGTAELMGAKVPQALPRVLPEVGALVEAPAAYGHLSGRANLALLDAAGPRSDSRTRRTRVAEALEQVGLAGVGRRPVRAYSLGMRQRLGLAGALLRRPKLLVLDEPTNGLDPQGIREVRDLLVGLNEAGTTLFVSSHLLAEVEHLCTRVGVLDRGRLVVQEELALLTAATGRVVLRTPDPARAAALLDGRVQRRDGDRLVVAGIEPEDLVALLVAAGLRVSEVSAERRTLEEVVLSMTSSGSDRIDRRARPEPSLSRSRSRSRAPPTPSPCRDPGRGPQAPAAAANLGRVAAALLAPAGRGALPACLPPRATTGDRTSLPLGGARERPALPCCGPRDRAALVPAGCRRGDRRGQHRGGGRRRDVALPARATRRSHQAACRETRGSAGVPAACGGAGRGDRIPHRYVVVRFRRRSRSRCQGQP